MSAVCEKPEVAKRAAPAGPAYWVEVAAAHAISKHIDDWQNLASHAAEPNPFYEPWMLLPALEQFGRDDDHAWVFVYRRLPNDTSELVGFFPWTRVRRYKSLPVRVLRMWKHLHCFLCTPLVREGHIRECLNALFSWAEKNTTLLDFAFAAADGPFQRHLLDLVNEREAIAFQDEAFHRALLDTTGVAEDYLRSILSSSHRSELRRQRKKLGEQGRLESRRLEGAGDIDLWIDQFLTLEASGWKGEEQTAFLADERQKRYFHDIVQAAFDRGQLMMLGLFLDDKPIALKCNFLSGAGSFSAKIAFDENYARFSPGVLLELDNIEWAHERREIRWMDSCAKPGHFMIERLWRERRTMQSLAVSTGKIRGDLFLGAMPLLRSLSRSWRRMTRKRPRSD